MFPFFEIVIQTKILKKGISKNNFHLKMHLTDKNTKHRGNVTTIAIFETKIFWKTF